VFPEGIAIQQAGIGQPFHRTLEIGNFSDTDWTSIAAGCEAGWLSASAEPLPRAPAGSPTHGSRQAWRLTLLGDARLLTPGRHSTRLEITATLQGGGTPIKSAVPIEVEAIGSVSVIPQQLFFGLTSPAKPATRQLILRFADEVALPDAHAVTTRRSLKGELTTQIEERGRYWSLTASFSPGANRQGVVREKIPMIAQVDSPADP
jgi:hypothetical protein